MGIAAVEEAVFFRGIALQNDITFLKLSAASGRMAGSVAFGATDESLKEAGHTLTFGYPARHILAYTMIPGGPNYLHVLSGSA